MTWSIYALLSQESPEITLASLLDDLHVFVSRMDEGVFTFELEDDPFDSNEKNILMIWDGEWWIRFFCDEGPDTVQDSMEIAKMLNNSQSSIIEKIDRRISVIFGDDESRAYTNHIICTIDFLQEIPGVFVSIVEKSVSCNQVRNSTVRLAWEE
jgi:hypothetical protein